MRHLILLCIAAMIAGATAATPNASDHGYREFRVRVTEMGKCELDGASLGCAAVGSMLLALCPSAKCSVLIDPDVRTKYDPVAEVLKSLQDAKFTHVSFAAKTRKQ